MKTLSMLLAGALAACQTAPSGVPGQDAPQRSEGVVAGTGTGTGAGASSAGAAMASGRGEKAGIGTWFGMCELNRQIAAARTPDERQAIIEHAMPHISKETREQQVQMMQQRCQ